SIFENNNFIRSIFLLNLHLPNEAPDLFMLRSLVVVFEGQLKLNCRVLRKHADDVGVVGEVEDHIEIEIATQPGAVAGEIARVNVVACSERWNLRPCALSGRPALLILEDTHGCFDVAYHGSRVEALHVQNERLRGNDGIHRIPVDVGQLVGGDRDSVHRARARVHVDGGVCSIGERTGRESEGNRKGKYEN
ncbi:hypothetical protein PENTCL1PPCAC_3515, partial [Pristionchus entomophagus]